MPDLNDFADRSNRDTFRRALIKVEAANHLIRTRGAGDPVATPRMIGALIRASRLMLDALDAQDPEEEFPIDFDTDLRILLDAEDEKPQEEATP